MFGRTKPPLYTVLSPRHAEACAALHAAAFARGWSALEFERLIGAETSFGEAALDGSSGALAGFVLSRAAAGEAEILTIAVGRSFRRRGIGRGLLVRHLAGLAEARIGALFLEVGEDNAAARHLYAALGFVEVGRRTGYYQSRPGQPPVAALVLRRALA